MESESERNAREGQPILAAEDLSKWYGEVIGLNSLNLEITPGITGIVGPNGSGKSTLFKTATGLVRPQTGTVRVMGQEPWSNEKLLSRVGFCPDYDSLNDESTGREFLELVGGLHGMSGGPLDSRIEEVVGIVDMEDAVGRRIGGYSKGMRQKIKLAGSILHDPDLLLLDEPLSGADPKSRRALIEVIKSLHEDRGHDIIVSSHVLYEIERMTHRVALIYRGRRIASGDISEIRGLIDEHPTNIIIEGEGMTALAKRLLDIEQTVSVEFEKGRDRIRIETRHPDEFFGSLTELLVEEDIEIENMYSPDEGLEAVFKYLVEG